jgi:hypothetical protein
MWLNSHGTDFSDACMQKLIPQYKCLSLSSDYIKNQLNYIQMFAYNNIRLFIIDCFVNTSPEVAYEIALVFCMQEQLLR